MPTREVSWAQSPPSLPQRVPDEHLPTATAHLWTTHSPGAPCVPRSLGHPRNLGVRSRRVGATRTASPRRGTAGRRGSWHSGRGHWLLSLCPALWPALADLRSSPFSRHDLRRPAAQALYKARTAALIRPRQRADSPPGGSHGAGAGAGSP